MQLTANLLVAAIRPADRTLEAETTVRLQAVKYGHVSEMEGGQECCKSWDLKPKLAPLPIPTALHSPNISTEYIT